jgi:hypothetical protein
VIASTYFASSIFKLVERLKPKEARQRARAHLGVVRTTSTHGVLIAAVATMRRRLWLAGEAPG